MTHRRNGTTLTLGLAVGLLAVAALVGGCGKKNEEKPKQAYVPPPPPPQAPLEDLEMDPRVQFPQSHEPSTRALAEGIAQLASSLVSGNKASMAEVLDDEGKSVLDTLVDTGQWDAVTKRIEAVRVCVLSEGESGTCDLGLGIQDPDGAYMLAWRGQRKGDAWVFTPSPLGNIEAPQLAALDNAALTPPELPAPVVLQVDPNANKLKPIERFSK